MAELPGLRMMQKGDKNFNLKEIVQDPQKLCNKDNLTIHINCKKMLPFTSPRISQIQECGEISLLTYNHPFPLACFLSQHLGRHGQNV